MSVSASCFSQVSDLADQQLFRSFGSEFLWGTASAAYQIEGAHNQDGRENSIWDVFAEKGKIKNNENGNVATDFYHRYKEDIALAKSMNFRVFRFSLSWSRIFPKGTGDVNPKGVEFYHKVVDECLREGLQPWVTLYHWDLPQELQEQGGWANRDVIEWFKAYTLFCAREYGSKVKNWMVFNEPSAFVGLGYLAGYHAPGKRNVKAFLKASHYACMAMAESGRILRREIPEAQIGTTFSCSSVDAWKDKSKHQKAAKRMDAMLNRMFIEPSLGLGYPVKEFPFLRKMKKFQLPSDEEKLKFDFDFIGLQNYFRVVVKRSPFIPFIWAKPVSAKKRNVPYNEMGFEIYPEGMYRILKQFAQYKTIKNIVITENGVCVKDELIAEQVQDSQRIDFFRSYLGQVLKAKQEGVPVSGYLVWSLTDNFEWTEGYKPRFGLVYVDYATQKRYIKDSGKWFGRNLEE
ncbi:MAG: GH1 family beta-glucosidase [Bacteroidota bacterium]